MACATCGGTMQNIGDIADPGFGRYFWCPRCGTLLSEHGDFKKVEAPAIVNRVRHWIVVQLATWNEARNRHNFVTLTLDSVFQAFHTFGIFEAVWQPHERPNTERNLHG